MSSVKINRVKLKNMLNSGKSQKECAEHFGVSEAAISQAKKELAVAVVKNVAMESAPKVIEKNLNAESRSCRTSTARRTRFLMWQSRQRTTGPP